MQKSLFPLPEAVEICRLSQTELLCYTLHMYCKHKVNAVNSQQFFFKKNKKIV